MVDLDTGAPAGFRRLLCRARGVGPGLRREGLPGDAGTHGAPGLHRVLPLAAETAKETGRLVAETGATRVAGRDPAAAPGGRCFQAQPASGVHVDFPDNIR